MKKILFIILLSGCLNTHSGNPNQRCGIADCTTASVNTETSICPVVSLMPPCHPDGCTDMKNHIHTRPLRNDYHLPPVRKSEKF